MFDHIGKHWLFTSHHCYGLVNQPFHDSNDHGYDRAIGHIGLADRKPPRGPCRSGDYFSAKCLYSGSLEMLERCCLHLDRADDVWEGIKRLGTGRQGRWATLDLNSCDFANGNRFRGGKKTNQDVKESTIWILVVCSVVCIRSSPLLSLALCPDMFYGKQGSGVVVQGSNMLKRYPTCFVL